MSRAEELRAELALLEHEADFAAAKAAGEVTPEQKLELREARRQFRELRAGSASAQPETVTATANVKKTGA